jgi:hypothetical protein
MEEDQQSVRAFFEESGRAVGNQRVGGRWSGHLPLEWHRLGPASRRAVTESGRMMIDLQDITGTSAGNVWAVGVGTTSCGEGVCYTGVIEHWNGSAWAFKSIGATLYGVDTTGPNNVYAVGLGLGPAILHYDGSGWATVPTPTPTPVGRLFAIDARSGGTAWAVGLQIGAGHERTLAERAPSPDSGAITGNTSGNATVAWFGPETGSLSANQLGGYQIGGLDIGLYTLTATYPGCSPASKQVEVKAGATIGVQLPISC